MKKLIALLFLLVTLASAQNYSTVSGSAVLDKNGVAVTGTIEFIPDREFGFVGGSMACCNKDVKIKATVTAGSFSGLPVPRADRVNPAGVCFTVIVRDTTGKIVQGPDGYRCVQPTGASYDFGTYTPLVAAVPNTPQAVFQQDCSLLGSSYVLQTINPDGTSKCVLGGGGGGSGTVTSVGLSVPGVLFSVGGSPVTTTGTLALSLLTQAPNVVLAGPTSGGNATPTLRSLVVADIPTLNQNTTGTAGGLSANIAESQVTSLVSDLALKSPLASPTFSGTVTGTFSGNITGNVTGNASGTAATITGVNAKGNQVATTMYTDQANTITAGKLTTLASATGGAGLNVPAGVAPSSPVIGDLWLNGANLFFRDNTGTPVTREVFNFTDTLPGAQVSGNIAGTAGGLSANITESQVASLVSDLALKAPLASPAFTGTVSAATITATGVVSGSSMTASGSNGGIDLLEGTEASLTKAVGHGLIAEDSTAHRTKACHNSASCVFNQLVEAGADINTSDQVTVTHLAAALPVPQGGTALASGTSGGILGFTGSTTVASSVALTANVLTKGGGAGATPTNSSITDNATTVTTTDTGGYVAPVFVANGATSGFFQCTAGSANGHATASTITDECPASVTAYEILKPSAAATGIRTWTNAAGVVTESITATTGSGSVVEATSPTITTPNITSIKDANGNPFLLSSATASAVDSLQITNAATANPATVTALPTGTDANINLALNAKGTGIVQASTFSQSTSNRVVMTADWTCGTGGTSSTCVSATIVGTGGTPLTLTLPLQALSWHWQCDGVVGQATAATANSWNFLTATNGATNVTASYTMNTAATAMTGGATTDQASTTTTVVIGPTWTLGGTATKMPFHIEGSIEGASASGTVLSLQLVAPTVADLVTIYRGASCSVSTY